MVDIQLLGSTIDSSKLQLILTAITIIVAIIFGYLTYRKKSAITTPKTSQSANNSSGVVQQKANNMNIENQTFNFNKQLKTEQLDVADLEITEEVVSYTLSLRDNTGEGYLEAHQLKVKNKGKIAAENVLGIIEDLNDTKHDKKLERKTSWHEGGGKYVPYTTINAGDHMFLNIYGIIMRRISNSVVSKIDAITMSTENGWDWHSLIDTGIDLKFAIRVTAKNAPPKRKVFKISRKNNLELEFLNED